MNALRKQGFDVWFDKNIITGNDWDDTIEEEIKAADAIVLLLSKTSVASDNVKDEMSYAMSLGKNLNPIKIEDCVVPMRLARKQFLDFTEMGQEAGFERLVKDLNHQLNNPEAVVVAKGIFIPPVVKASNHKHTVPKYNNSLLYIIGGIIFGGGLVVLFIFFLAAFLTTEDVDYTDDYNKTIIETTIAQDWVSAANSNTIDSYIEFLRTYGKNNTYYNEAFTNMKNMFSDSGYVKYGIVDVEQYFDKIVYFDGYELTIPVQGGFISPKMENEIWKNNNPSNYFVQPERFYLVLDVVINANNEVWVHLAI